MLGEEGGFGDLRFHCITGEDRASVFHDELVLGGCAASSSAESPLSVGACPEGFRLDLVVHGEAVVAFFRVAVDAS